MEANLNFNQFSISGLAWKYDIKYWLFSPKFLALLLCYCCCVTVAVLLDASLEGVE